MRLKNINLLFQVKKTFLCQKLKGKISNLDLLSAEGLTKDSCVVALLTESLTSDTWLTCWATKGLTILAAGNSSINPSGVFGRVNTKLESSLLLLHLNQNICHL